MPGLRFGPDITDDAATLQNSEREARITMRNSRSERARNAARNRLRAIDEATKQIFGNKRTRNTLARYSVARQGYEAGGGRSRIGGRRGQTGLVQSPLGAETQIPRRGGRYRARPAIPERDKASFRAATRRARPGQVREILQQVIRQQQAQTRAANRRRSRAGAAGRARRG